MVRPKREKPSVQISVRVEPEIAEELDAVAADLKRVNVGGLGSRVDALRAVIDRGLRALREELDEKLAASPPAAKRPARKR